MSSLAIKAHSMPHINSNKYHSFIKYFSEEIFDIEKLKTDIHILQDEH